MYKLTLDEANRVIDKLAVHLGQSTVDDTIISVKNEQLTEAKRVLQCFVRREIEFSKAFNFGRDDVMIDQARKVIDA